MTTDEKSLRERIAIAKAATPGKWATGIEDSFVGTHHKAGFNAHIQCESAQDAAHIAANSPEAVIELCEALVAHKQSIHGLLAASAKQYAELLELREYKDRNETWRTEMAKLLVTNDPLARIAKLEAALKKVRKFSDHKACVRCDHVFDVAEDALK